jgi:hypothetical protein
MAFFVSGSLAWIAEYILFKMLSKQLLAIFERLQQGKLNPTGNLLVT